VLFDSALIDYDYIMKLIARFSEKGPTKQKMTRERLIGLLSSSARLLDERNDMKEYIDTLEEGQGLSEKRYAKATRPLKPANKPKKWRALPKNTHSLPRPCKDLSTISWTVTSLTPTP